MSIFLTVLHIIVCLVLVTVILFQAGRGQGLTGSSFGASGGVNTLFGTKAGDFFTKATSVCAILFLVTCISLDIVEARRSRSLVAPGGEKITQADMDKIKEALEKLKAEAKEKEAKVEGVVDEAETSDLVSDAKDALDKVVQ